MTKLPAWHRNAPKPETPKTGDRPMWATEPARDPNKISDAPMYDEHVPGPDLRMPDGRMFDFKTAPKAKPKKPRKGLGKGLAELIEDGDKTPRRFRCIEDPSAGLLRMIGKGRRI